MHTWISKIIGTTSMRKSDIWTNISYGIVIRVPKSKMEMWKGGAAADKITINIWTVILGVVTNCFPNPVILYIKVPSTYIIYIHIMYIILLLTICFFFRPETPSINNHRTWCLWVCQKVEIQIHCLLFISPIMQHIQLADLG